jgi:hypothetical protein
VPACYQIGRKQTCEQSRDDYSMGSACASDATDHNITGHSALYQCALYAARVLCLGAKQQLAGNMKNQLEKHACTHSPYWYAAGALEQQPAMATATAIQVDVIDVICARTACHNTIMALDAYHLCKLIQVRARCEFFLSPCRAHEQRAHSNKQTWEVALCCITFVCSIERM